MRKKAVFLSMLFTLLLLFLSTISFAIENDSLELYLGGESLTAVEKASSDKDLSRYGSMIFDKESYVFKGKAVKPKVTVYCDGKKLKKKKEYALIIENNTSIGYGRVTVTGAGNYSGEFACEFPIVPQLVKLKKLLKIETGLEAIWKVSKDVDGYEIEYAANSGFSGSFIQKAEGGQAVSAKLTKLEPNTVYYVRLRSYKNVSNSAFYSAWSKPKSLLVDSYQKDDDGDDDGGDDEEKAPYMVVDLSGGPNASKYPVSYLNEVPKGGWGTDYKTIKMVFKLVSAGSFYMGSPEGEIGRNNDETLHKVTLTKSFYIGVFEVTQNQYELITGKNPSLYKEKTYPVERINFSLLRGAKGKYWPQNDEVNDDSFVGMFRIKTGLHFDLPTEAQLEYACRAGKSTSWNNGSNITNFYTDGNLAKLGRYHDGHTFDDDGNRITHLAVGSFLPNDWGLYDMHGNVGELCLDYFEALSADPVTDPVGSTTMTSHVIKGGSWSHSAAGCRSASRNTTATGEKLGFRMVVVE